MLTFLKKQEAFVNTAIGTIYPLPSHDNFLTLRSSHYIWMITFGNIKHRFCYCISSKNDITDTPGTIGL